ncbi:MAG: hypothetical protein U0610_24120 [bacterium]
MTVGGGASRRRTPARVGALAGIALLTVLAYAPALRAPLSYDDPFLVQRSPVVIGRHPLGAAFRLGYWEGIAPDRGNEYRPLTILALALEHRVFGDEPAGYRWVSWLLHLGCVVAVGGLARRLGLSAHAALGAQAVFALHPIHVEAVTSIVGQGELLQTLLSLATVLVFLAEGAVAACAWPLLALAALLAKEAAIVAPALAALVACWLRLGRRERVRSPWAALAMVPILLGYFALRMRVLGELGGTRAVGVIENPLVAIGGPGRLVAGAWLLARYAWLHVFPVRLSADYGFACLTPPTSLASPLSWLPLAGWCALAVGALARPRALFALLAGWFVLGLAVVSNVAFPIGTIFGERLAYLASVAPCLAAGAGYERVRRAHPGGVGALALAVVGLLALRAADRNLDYASDERLFAAAVRVCPASVKARFNLAALRAQRGDLAGARRELDAALAVKPDWPLALAARGRVRFEAGERDAATADFEAARSLDPDDAVALAGLGDVARARGDCAAARSLYARRERGAGRSVCARRPRGVR